jgi:guanylate cyclase
MYDLRLNIRIVESENNQSGGTTGPINITGGLKSVIVKYRLDFDNREYVMKLKFPLKK